jgi:hypothetical protein
VRALVHPKTLRSSIPAALGSAVLALPRIILWPGRSYPVWYLETVLFLSGIVLWSFVFAWHGLFTGQPIFTLRIRRRHAVEATVAGLLCAALLHFFIDPRLRSIIPDEYPSSVLQLVAMALFSLGFGQLFTIFAPFAWSLRLFRDGRLAAVLTVLFGVALMITKKHSGPVALPAFLLVSLMILTIASVSLSIYWLLRGGILLVWWFTLLAFSRHLIQLFG